MNEIWVPSIYLKKLMKQSNIFPPVHVMPLGVDVDRYKPNCGSLIFGSNLRSFRFLCNSKYSYRKGFDILIKAFMEEFSNDDDVSLLLVTRPLGTSLGGIQSIVDDFNAIKSSVKKSEDNLPHVALYTKSIPEKDMPKVYNSCHAYVLISRGEGFSLTPIEAAATGLPVIASNIMSHTDFLKEDNAFLVEPEGYIKAQINGHLSNMAKMCRFYEDQLFPDFGEESIKQTQEYMRFVYNNYSKAKEKASKLRNYIVNNFTWNMAIDKIYKRVRELQ